MTISWRFVAYAAYASALATVVLSRMSPRGRSMSNSGASSEDELTPWVRVVAERISQGADGRWSCRYKRRKNEFHTRRRVDEHARYDRDSRGARVRVERIDIFPKVRADRRRWRQEPLALAGDACRRQSGRSTEK